MIPVGNSIRTDIRRFQTGQVVGFYVTRRQGSSSTSDRITSSLSHVILAHELTHAMDDQHFGLDRLDRLVATCDGRGVKAAAVGAIEGSAQFFAFEVRDGS